MIENPNSAAVVALRIKVVGDGWSRDAAYTVKCLCDKHDIPFIDRGAVHGLSGFNCDRVISEVRVDPHTLPLSYVFFAHRGIKDLPYTHETQVIEAPVEEQKAVQAVEKSTEVSRKVVEGSKRFRPEFKERLAACKSSKSLSEFLTNLHDLLLTNPYSVAVKEDGKFVFRKSLTTVAFEYGVNDLNAVPKFLTAALDELRDRIKTRSKPEVLTGAASHNKTPRVLILDAYCADSDANLWVLTAKPGIIETSLY